MNIVSLLLKRREPVVIKTIEQMYYESRELLNYLKDPNSWSLDGTELTLFAVKPLYEGLFSDGNRVSNHFISYVKFYKDELTISFNREWCVRPTNINLEIKKAAVVINQCIANELKKMGFTIRYCSQPGDLLDNYAKMMLIVVEVK